MRLLSSRRKQLVGCDESAGLFMVDLACLICFKKQVIHLLFPFCFVCSEFGRLFVEASNAV
jgi:hypothetical protein